MAARDAAASPARRARGREGEREGGRGREREGEGGREGERGGESPCTEFGTERGARWDDERHGARKATVSPARRDSPRGESERERGVGKGRGEMKR